MSAENERKPIVFGSKYAWNLAKEAINDGVVPRPTSSPEEELLDMGEKRLWINQTDRERALRMFVFSDQITLPLMVSSVFPLNNSLFEDGHISRLIMSVNPENLVYVAKTAEELQRSRKLNYYKHISRSLYERTGISVKESDIKLVAQTEHPNIQRWQNSERMTRLIDLEYLDYMETAANIYFGNRIFRDITSADIDQRNLETFQNSEVVAIYFKNFIQVPHPLNFRDAIRMRKNKNIAEWRNRISSLSWGLAEGTMNENTIIKEVQEGNKILQGTKDMQLAGSPLASFLILSADVATEVVPILKAAKIAVKVGSYASTYLQFHGWIAQKAIESGVDEKIRWLFVCN